MQANNWNYKEGVIISGIDPAFYMTLWQNLGLLIKGIAQAPATITAALDGKHSVNSLHSSGKAVDIRIRDWKCDVSTLAKAIAYTLGEKFVVVEEKDHLHIQLSAYNVFGEIKKIGSGNYIKSIHC